jgi:branched-subunit amino acid transport protein
MPLDYSRITFVVLIMALVTYLTRALPLLFFRREITQPLIRSFLYYLPYAVLSAMTIPNILYSTSSFYSGLAALAVGLILSFFEKGLLLTALGAALAAFALEKLLGLY